MTDTAKELRERFRLTTEELVQLIGKFDQASFNRKPADGGWSAGEVTEHLLLFDIRLNQVLDTSTTAADRDPLEKVPVYTQRVTDRSNKLDAPPFLVPSPGDYSPSVMAEKISMERNKVIKAIEEKDLTLISAEFPHRFFGEMTAQEWIVFLDMHTHRHLPQLQALLAA